MLVTPEGQVKVGEQPQSFFIKSGTFYKTAPGTYQL